MNLHPPELFESNIEILLNTRKKICYKMAFNILDTRHFSGIYNKKFKLFHSIKLFAMFLVIAKKKSYYLYIHIHMDCKEIQPVHSEGDQPWDFFGRNDAKAETPVLWPPHAKNWLIGKVSDAGRDWGQEEKGMTEDEMAGWHHWLNGRESEWTPGVGDGQWGLACWDSWGRKESDTTDWTELNWMNSICELNEHRANKEALNAWITVEIQNF